MVYSPTMVYSSVRPVGGMGSWVAGCFGRWPPGAVPWVLWSLQCSITLPALRSGAAGRDDLLLMPSRSFAGCVRGLHGCKPYCVFNSRLEYRYSCFTVFLIVDLNIGIRALL